MYGWLQWGLAVATIVTAPLAAEVVTYAAIPMANTSVCTQLAIGAAVKAAEVVGDVNLSLNSSGDVSDAMNAAGNLCKEGYGVYERWQNDRGK